MTGHVAENRRVREVLRDLGETGSAGRDKEPRWFHPFPARMPLSVAEHLISELTSSKARVLDPMMGSGTTLIAARKLGRESHGFDRDPLALSLARCATSVFRTERMDALRGRLLDKARERLERTREHREFGLAALPREDREFLEYWFPESSQDQLFALVNAISGEEDADEVELAWVVFSSLIIAKTAGASYALDIPRSRPHKKEGKLIVPPFEGWDRRFRHAMRTLPFVDDDDELPSCTPSRGDARELSLGDESVELVLTSPPYLTAVDYLRGHKFSLVWREHQLATLRELRGTMIGTERGLWERDGIPDPLEDLLAEGFDQDRRRAQVRRYLSDLKKVLKQLQRILVPGGLAILVVGPSIVDRSRCDSEEILGELASSVDLKPVGSVIRALESSSRSLPPPGSGESAALARRMRTEVILALRK